MTRPLLAFLALVAIVQAASGQPARSPMRCVQAEVLVERAQGAVKEIRVLTPEQTERVLSWYNEQPPPSSDTYNTMVVMAEEGGRLSLFYGYNGLVCGGMRVNPQAINTFLRALMDGWGI